MKLIIKWDEFSLNIVEYIDKVDDLIKTESTIKSQEEFERIKDSVKIWIDECYTFLNKSFDVEKNEFAHEFHNAREQRFHIGIGGRQKDFVTIKKEFYQDLNIKRKTLEYFLRILKVSDIIIIPNEIDLEIRHQYSTEETLDLILEKLYILYDNSYHPILSILEGNGIPIKRHGEERELTQLLENNGYVNTMNTRDVYAQLTTQGKIYIENRHKVKSSDYSHIKESSSEIHDKIEEIIKQLQKLGLGQEVIFVELEELKVLYGSINNKNWGQLLKGKLIDLGLSQIINIDTMKFIYKELTTEILKLN